MPSNMLGKTCALAGGASIAVLMTLVVTACGDDADAGRDSGPGAGRTHGLTKQQSGEVLVKVGDTSITVGDFAARLADQSPYLRARYNSPERRREFLDNLIRFELLAAEARRRGYEKLPDVDRTRKQVMIQQMMKAEFEDRVRLQDVTDQEIQAYYEAHPEEFNKPEQVRVSHIQMADRAAAQRVLAQILAAPNDVALFRRLAEQHNVDPETRDRLGDLRFFSRIAERQAGEPEVAPPIVEAAFAIPQIGGVHRELVRSERGWHIVKLTGKRAALHRTLEEARRPIQNRLWREKRERAIEEFITRLRREANVQENLALLSEVRLNIPEGMPAELPELPDHGNQPMFPGLMPGVADPHAHPEPDVELVPGVDGADPTRRLLKQPPRVPPPGAP
jgi:peptidyl-prolyl cis-trans isomerase C